jgi:AcrR family transcriptional regulator
MSAVTARPSEARNRLLRTASDIFYREGIHGVGVDAVLDRAAVTRSTFYRHFPSKEALVVAYINAADQAVRNGLETASAAQTEAGPQAGLLTLTDLMGTAICRPGFRGCPFINAAAEYPDPGSTVHQAVLEHRNWLKATVVTALQQAGHPEPERAARCFIMLRDGAMVAGYLNDPDEAAQTLRQAVEELLHVGP